MLMPGRAACVPCCEDMEVAFGALVDKAPEDESAAFVVTNGKTYMPIKFCPFCGALLPGRRTGEEEINHGPHA